MSPSQIIDYPQLLTDKFKSSFKIAERVWLSQGHLSKRQSQRYNICIEAHRQTCKPPTHSPTRRQRERKRPSRLSTYSGLTGGCCFADACKSSRNASSWRFEPCQPRSWRASWQLITQSPLWKVHNKSINMNIYTYTHQYMYTYTHTYLLLHTHIHRHIHKYIHKYTHNTYTHEL